MDLDTLRRTLLQRLESDRRFGLTHLPPAKGTFDLTFLRDAERGSVGDSSGAAVNVTARSTSTLERPVAKTGSLDPPVTAIPLGENITPPNTERPSPGQ